MSHLHNKKPYRDEERNEHKIPIGISYREGVGFLINKTPDKKQRWVSFVSHGKDAFFAACDMVRVWMENDRVYPGNIRKFEGPKIRISYRDGATHRYITYRRYVPGGKLKTVNIYINQEMDNGDIYDKLEESFKDWKRSMEEYKADALAVFPEYSTVGKLSKVS